MSFLAPIIPAALGGTATSTLPLTLASLAASGVGGLLNNREESRARDRRDDSNQAIDAAERVRQDQIRAQSQQALNDLVQRQDSRTRPTLISQEADRLGRSIQPALPIAPQSPLQGQQNASEVIRTDAARKLSDAAAETRKRLAALAGLSAFDTSGQRLAEDRAVQATDQSVRANLAHGGLRAAQEAKSFNDLEFQNFRPSGLGSLISGTGQLGAFAAGGAGVGGAPLPFTDANGFGIA